jgi:hypothetical protein
LGDRIVYNPTVCLYTKKIKYLHWKFEFHLLFMGCTTNAVYTDGTRTKYDNDERNTMNVKLMQFENDEREYNEELIL